MARRRISILDNFLSGGNVGKRCLNSAKATLKASTLILSLVACANLYFWVALLLLRLSSRVKWVFGVKVLPFTEQSLAMVIAMDPLLVRLWVWFRREFVWRICVSQLETRDEVDMIVCKSVGDEPTYGTGVVGTPFIPILSSLVKLFLENEMTFEFRWKLAEFVFSILAVEVIPNEYMTSSLHLFHLIIENTLWNS